MVGPSKNDNYLAHSVKCLELLIFQEWQRPYLILTSGHDKMTGSILYQKEHCVIFFPYGNGVDDKRSRLILAHELGHLARNIPKLGELRGLDEHQNSSEDEAFAWEFAYHLILSKSGFYTQVDTLKSFIFKQEVLCHDVCALVEELNPEVLDLLLKKIKPN